MTTRSSRTVLILGAGVTGLAVAYRLSGQAHHVTLLDHSEWQDGFCANPADAVPILFGSHHETWRLIHALTRRRTSPFGTIIPLQFRLPDGRVVAYRSARLPGALHWIASLLSFQGLSRHDRWKLFSHVEQIWEQAQSLPADLESRIADEWLASTGQSLDARVHIWGPLAQWLTGNSLDRLSAATLVRLLSIVFLDRASDSRLTHLGGSVRERLLIPMKRAIEKRGIEVHIQSQLPSLRFGEDRVDGVRLHDGTVLRAQWYIAALSHQKLLALLPDRLLARYAYFAQLSELKTLSEISVQLVYPRHLTIRHPQLLLLADSPFHQLTIANGPDELRCRLAAIGNQPLTELSDKELIHLGRAAWVSLYPQFEKERVRSVTMSRKVAAALSLRPGAALHRPIQQSPLRNLLVAGAWTDTGWPANLESALVSATRATGIITGCGARPPL